MATVFAISLKNTRLTTFFNQTLNFKTTRKEIGNEHSNNKKDIKKITVYKKLSALKWDKSQSRTTQKAFDKVESGFV